MGAELGTSVEGYVYIVCLALEFFFSFGRGSSGSKANEGCLAL